MEKPGSQSQDSWSQRSHPASKQDANYCPQDYLEVRYRYIRIAKDDILVHDPITKQIPTVILGQKLKQVMWCLALTDCRPMLTFLHEPGVV